MRRQTLIGIAMTLLATATLLLTIDVVQVRRQQLTRQDVHEIVDSVLTEIYD